MSKLKKIFVFVGIGCLLLVLISDWFIVFNIKTTGGMERCAKYFKKFDAQYNYPIGNSNWTGRKLVYCSPGAKGFIFYTSDEFSIYTVTVKAQQEAAYDLLKTIVGKNPEVPLELVFYEKENLIQWKNEQTGASGAKRGSEKIINRYRIK